MIYIIAAADEKNGIGKNGQLPWHFKKEMRFFAETTAKTTDPAKKNIVIMGRTTWDSLNPKYKPLPHRRNIVLSHDLNLEFDGAEIAHSLEEAIKMADKNIENIFIIGGAKVFASAMRSDKIDGIYLTRIHKVYDCDTFLPQIPEKFSNIKTLGSEEENGVKFEYVFMS
ncbi:dihydrofolate reductase [Candidatus Peregrinibacteria bacterium]|nr:dihydrofolate reductase [Candidatus Peregrinibacteria bacterium]